jgi:hypothetical protein
MKPVSILFAASCLLLALCARASGSAQVMVDACVTNDPGILQLFDSTAFMLNLNFQQVVKNADQTYAMVPMGTYTISPYAQPLDPASAYYGLPQAPTGRTAVLISNNTMLTVAHSNPFGYASYAYIFGLRAKIVGGVCQYPDTTHIPPENIYFASMASGQYNGVVLNTHVPDSLGDYAVITLDRPVVGRTPLAVRKSGFASPQARFAGVSFSQRLIPAKADLAIQHINEDSPNGVQIANTSMMPGASGSPVYNLDEGVIETLGALINSCVYFAAEPSGLYVAEENCPGYFSSVNGPVTVISTLPGFHDADLIFRSWFEQ